MVGKTLEQSKVDWEYGLGVMPAGDVAVLDQVDKVHLSNNLKETGE